MSEQVESVAAQVERLRGLVAGGGLLAALTALDPSAGPLDARVAMLELAEAACHAVDAWRQRLLAGLRYGDSRDDDDWIREEVAAALGLSPTTAASRLEVARGLVDRFPRALAVLESGTVPYGHVRALVEGTAHLDDDSAARVERRVLPKAVGMPVGAFRNVVERTAAKLDPATPAERHDEACRERRVWKKAAPNGMTLLAGVVPAEQGAVAWSVLDEAARRSDDDDTDDERTLEQRRADAFVDLLTGTHPDSTGSDTAASPDAPTVTVDVVVSADTLRGETDGPAVLDDAVTLTAGPARVLAYSDGARWRRLVIDPRTGRLLACGEKRYLPGNWRELLADQVEPIPPAVPQYRPPPRLARYVCKRDRFCCFPGCRRRAVRCDLDHRIPWPDGGTSAANLHPLCRRHHRLKHHGGWRLDNNDNGSYTWTSPLGRTYTDWPHDYHDDT